MQFIEELTLIHKAAIGGAVVLIALFVVLAKRRRAATPAGATAEAPAKQPRGRKRAKAESSLPRRKRRKLAAEAAHLGLEAPAAIEHQIPEVPAVPALPEPIAEELFEDEVPEPVMVQVAAAPAAVVAEDPYVHGAPLNINIEPEVVVAQPGWPAPGELATTFDPDSFDPDPEMYGPLNDDALCEPLDGDPAEMVAVDDTAALELSALSTADEVAALDEIEEWAAEVEEEEWQVAVDAEDAAETWAVAETPAPTDMGVVSAEQSEDLEELWSEPDDEPLWTAEPAAHESIVEVDTDDQLQLDDSEITWPEDVADSWSTDAPVVAATPDAPVADAWNGQLGSANSPVVLDLAGLAASGQALELVIEPNADGHGVRLRFGAPTSGTQASDPVAVDEAPMPDPGEFGVSLEDCVPVDFGDVHAAPDVVDEVLVDDQPTPVESDYEVPFLAGVAPGGDAPADESPSIAEVSPTADMAWEQFDAPVAVAQDAPSFGETEGVVEAESAFAPSTPQTATAVMDDDDPARILADIRARLAALDARR